VKAAAPKPSWAKAGAAASFGSASRCYILEAKRAKAGFGTLSTQNIENNPMQSSRRATAQPPAATKTL
jgi:hypothetical protein